jgi:outer membrane protein assembly factor BamB
MSITLTRIATIAFAVTLTTEITSAHNWPEFRGPTGDGVSTARNVPLLWNATENVKWNQSIPGTGWSSPVLSDHKLYLTTAVTDDANAVSLRALCLDAANGRILWNVEVFRPDEAAAKQAHSKNSLASPTPLVAGERVYVHFGHMGTAALDLAGNVVWKQETLKYRPRHGNAGSPVLASDLLIFSCDAEENPFVVALESGNGSIRWRSERHSPAIKKFSFSTPTVIDVDGQQQIISPASGYVGAYDSADGREIWRVSYEGYSLVPRPVFAHGLIFVSSGFEVPTLLAIDPKGASGDVTQTHIAWQREKGAPLTSSPLVVGDELYVVTDGGVASCFDARTGKVHWAKRLGGNFSASPVYASGRVYFQSEEGVTHVVAAGKKFERLATNDIEERTLASMAVDDNTLYLRSESNLRRIGTSE